MKRQIILLLPLIASCGKVGDSTAKVLDTTLPSPAQPSQAVLGKGYNTKEERFAGDCVKGTTEYAGAPEGSVNFDRSQTLLSIPLRPSSPTRSRPLVGI